MRTSNRLAVSCVASLLAALITPVIGASSGLLSFPRDDGAHPAFAVEHWRFVGHLRTASGRRFDYTATFGRFAITDTVGGGIHASRSKWASPDQFAAVLAVTDEQTQDFVSTSTFTRDTLGLASASVDHLALIVNRWSVQSTYAGAPLPRSIALNGSDGATALALVMAPSKPPSLHDGRGTFRNQHCLSCVFRFYSYSRLQTSGSLTLHGERYKVEGLSWMDHDFGPSVLPPDAVGRDIFSLQLNDGNDLMLLQTRRRDGTVVVTGTFIGRDGTSRQVPMRAYHAKRGPFSWRSDKTDVIYPDLWHFVIPALGLDLTVTPTAYDQEIVLSRRGEPYWDGAVDVQDVAGGKPIGAGYAQLLGYRATGE